MARRCDITLKGVMVGNNVSHANNKRKKRSEPNLRNMRVKLEDGTRLKLKVAVSTLRTLKKPKVKKKAQEKQEA
ncbi:50S ribosomal protein L28 [Helicobacter saguini]|uniref:Large ribosomal subunit protein bL28 n=1 Tax=Helicobacter saguini TaxID=1548018 RepID=A0A347VSS7_9HELI|nr:50S ribosomal protein L28 [Helicobacter saguini]MWV62380.1 50S ribosomal protein L28 [Helicobacter saguini]MWV66948.1 50S ribosomal protein L28 [Helicobacter saguini]MWV69296.1 50S ribosomal protein L28 [Helicobacter saguini]MWV71148.1 50S ribosomal protein L28 [Helicobacter saguini]TLD94961.1 50S ribosomal protein L28 [Helicobacter saguini]